MAGKDPRGNIEIGEVIEERYKILEMIGEGGFGVVYKAEQIRTSQKVAVKVLQPDKLSRSSNPEQEVARFEREMKLIAGLNHPNIVRLIDSGRLDNGDLFMVLEFVDGRELAEVIKEEGALRPREARRVMLQVLEALHCAHDAGVVHRDLKPQNIMITSVGGRRAARVLDFGIASLVEEARDADYVTLTQTGQVHGTPIYMSPEQLEGRVTPQTDIYAWGLVFLECLTGTPAFTGDSFASIIYKQLAPDPVPMPEALESDGLGRFLRKALEKDPEKRFSSTGETLAALENVEVLGPSSVNPVISRAELNHAQIVTGENPVPGSHTEDAEIVSGVEDTVAVATPDRLTARELEVESSTETLSETAAATLAMDSPKSPGSRRTALIFGGAILALALIAVVVLTQTDLLDSEDNPADIAQQCPEGKVANRDTHGHCCWPGQAWNGTRCVGVPAGCPEGLFVDPKGQRCALPPCGGGKLRAADGTHCCWPEQAWSDSEQACIGTPACPEGYLLHDNTTCLGLSDTARKLLTACDDRGELEACSRLGMMFQEGQGAERSDSKAIELFERVCKNGLPIGCYKLGLIYATGLGVERDATKAIPYFEQACEANAMAACHTLGWIYAAGIGTLIRPRTSLLYFEKACNNNYVPSCDTLGLKYHYGDGVPRSPDKARELLKKACDSGIYLYACTHYGWVLEANPTGPEDLEKAAGVYENACNNHDTLACVNAAYLFEQGIGVPKKLDKAKRLYETACEDRWNEACLAAERL